MTRDWNEYVTLNSCKLYLSKKFSYHCEHKEHIVPTLVSVSSTAVMLYLYRQIERKTESDQASKTFSLSRQEPEKGK